MTFLELTHFKRECRLLSVLLISDLIFQMLQTAALIFSSGYSQSSSIAALSGFPSLIAVAFITCALLVLPYLFVQAFKPFSPCRKYVVKTACAALCVSGVLQVYMAFLSRVLDLDTVTWIFVRNGVWTIALAAILAYGLNNKQIREVEKEIE